MNNTMRKFEIVKSITSTERITCFKISSLLLSVKQSSIWLKQSPFDINRCQ